MGMQNVDYLLEAKHTVLLEQQSLNRKFAALEEEQCDSLRQKEEINSSRQLSLVSPSLDMQMRPRRKPSILQRQLQKIV
jgi:hypothetical protein